MISQLLLDGFSLNTNGGLEFPCIFKEDGELLIHLTPACISKNTETCFASKREPGYQLLSKCHHRLLSEKFMGLSYLILKVYESRDDITNKASLQNDVSLSTVIFHSISKCLKVF